jgi:hypothetical protein
MIAPIPPRLSRRPRDGRGFPVPWFVQWFKDGAPVDETEPGAEPDFRVMHTRRFEAILRNPRCWICGEPLGGHRVFVIGPMCAVNRINSEPPSHRECAEYAVKACPFLTRPRMRRNEKDLPDGGVVAGIHLDRNPGAACLWETSSYWPWRVDNGLLFRLGDPVRVDWWKEGRRASRAEVLTSIDSGFPILLEYARQEGAKAVFALAAARERVMRLLPAAA